EADRALREKAFELLESVAGQLGMLQSPENRARMGANIADSLWERDEGRARTLFLSVQNDINAGIRNTTGDPLDDSQRRMVFFQLRINPVERLPRHEGALALAFFRATEPPRDTSQTNRGPANDEAWRDEEREFELHLAEQIAGNNPEVALEIARESLAQG